MSYFPAGVLAWSASVPGAMKLILLVSVAMGLSASILAWRERPQPGAVPLVFLLVGQSWWAISILFRLDAVDPGAELAWLHLSWLGTVVIPVAWLFFCLEYAGHHQYVRPRYIALASVIPVLTAVFSLTNGYHQLLYVNASTVVDGAVLVKSPGVWYWVIAGYTYLLGLLGAIPLVQFISSDVDLFRGQSLALLGGLLVPWTTNFLYLTGTLPTAGVDPTPAAFALSGVAYLGAITRFDLFETTPAPIKQARFTHFDQMQAGAIVIDSRDHVVELNSKAEKLLSRPFEAVLGNRIEDVVPTAAAVLHEPARSGQTIFHPPASTGAYDISVTDLTDSRGRRTGRMITLHEISDYIRQQQRLEVLNRVFRHNVRTNTQVVIGKAGYLATHNSERAARTVQENAFEIERISEKVRTVLDIFAQSRERTRFVRLERVLSDCLERLGERYPDTTIEADLSAQAGDVSTVMEDVFDNVLENAAQHNTSEDPRIWVDVTVQDETVEIVVADNGPGIDDEELSLLDDGTETALKHGTGFGLAIIIWGTAIAGGDIIFEENAPTGLRVTIELPLSQERERLDSIDRPETTRRST